MRITLPLLATCAVLAACSDPREVASTPPTVSYQVRGDDISQTNVQAQNYCARYGRSALFQGVQSSPSGNVAVYSCNGAGVSAAPSAAPLSGSTVAPGPPTPLTAGVQCADALHQDRPGGSDYRGPPVVGCPPSR
jgi:hypothetical protein